MAQTKTKITYPVARDLVERIVKELSPVCQRIEIAGSVRRQKKLIGDIEIVCIAKQQLNLFGDPAGSLLAPHLEFLAEEGRIIKGDKWGEKYKKLHVPAMPELGIDLAIAIDLFITTPDEWGYTYTIRTGCAEFSHLIVTPRQHGGYLPGHLRVGGCRLWESDKALPTPEEGEFFAALGLRWIEPDLREVGLFERLILRERVTV